MPTEITPNEVRLMSMIMCTISEIAAFYELSERQLYRRFAKDVALKKAFVAGRAQGRRMIRQKQFSLAVDDGDSSMLKWLGMNLLGQSAHHAVAAADLNTVMLDDAIDGEFEEILDTIDAEIEADGHSLGMPAVGIVDAGADEGPGLVGGPVSDGEGSE